MEHDNSLLNSANKHNISSGGELYTFDNINVIDLDNVLMTEWWT